MVDVFKGAEKFVSAIQRNLWSYRVERHRVVLIWENFKTCLSVCKEDNKVSRRARVGQGINKNKTQQKPQKPTEQSIGLFIWGLIGFSFSFQSMDDLAVEEFERTVMVMSPKAVTYCNPPSFHSSETGVLSKGNGREMGLSRFNDAENNKEHMF